MVTEAPTLYQPQIAETQNFHGLVTILGEHPAFRQLCDRIRAGDRPTHPLGVTAPARSYVAAGIADSLDVPVLILTARIETARLIVEQLRMWLDDRGERVHFFADPDALPFERIAWTRETRQARLGALASMARLGRPGSMPAPAPIVVSTIRGLMQQTAPLQRYKRYLRIMRRNDIIDLQDLLRHWITAGYRNEALVEEPGVFSRRGGIIDIWPPNEALPVRIELWGDEVDSLRRFDPSTQRTLPDAFLERVEIGPGSEAILENGKAAARRLQDLDTDTCHPPAQVEFERDADHLSAETAFRGIEYYLPYLYAQPATLLDYLPDKALLLIDAAADIAAVALDLEGQALQVEKDLIKSG